MCSAIEVWQAEGLAGVILSGASGVLANASIGRGRGSGILFEAKDRTGLKNDYHHDSNSPRKCFPEAEATLCKTRNRT